MPLTETVHCPELSEPGPILQQNLDPSRVAFFSVLFRALERHHVRYCALHAHNGLLHGTDFLVHPADRRKFIAAFTEVQELGFRFVQLLRPRPGVHRLVFVRLTNTGIERVMLDVVFEREGVRAENIALQGSMGNTFWTSTDKRSKRRAGSNPSLYVRLAFWVHKVLDRFSRKGAFIVFLGPDGVGKTTLLRAVSKSLTPLFPEQALYRWRPAMFARSPRLNCLPHSKPMRGTWSSISYLLFTWADFFFGYFVSIRSLLSRNGLALFDRYYHDLLIDPKRYRYTGPMWLVQKMARLIPPRDIFFVVLEAEEQTILSRKQQLPIEEVRRQRTAYREFAKQVSASVVISTEWELDQCRTDVLDHIFTYLSTRLTNPDSVWLRQPEVTVKTSVSQSGE